MLLENEIDVLLPRRVSVGSGKSNFLAAMTWELRQKLARQFAVTFTDGDKEANWVSTVTRRCCSSPTTPTSPTVLEKTRTQGDLYRSVK